MRSILIAQPTTGTVASGTAGYLMQLGKALTAAKIGWDYKQLPLGDTALARNIFASHLIADNLHSHVLFTGPEIGFAPETVVRLFELEKPFSGAACPRPYVAWDTIRRLGEADAAKPADRRRSTPALMDLALDYDVATANADGTPWQPRRQGRFVTLPAIGAGLMLVHRDVFEIMLAHEVVRTRPGQTGLPLLDKAPLCEFFAARATADGSRTEPDDIAFCRRWVEDCGGEIWVDIESRIMHYGTRGHSGRYLPRAMNDFSEFRKG